MVVMLSRLMGAVVGLVFAGVVTGSGSTTVIFDDDTAPTSGPIAVNS